MTPRELRNLGIKLALFVGGAFVLLSRTGLSKTETLATVAIYLMFPAIVLIMARFWRRD